jgi:hypothetical protein
MERLTERCPESVCEHVEHLTFVKVLNYVNMLEYFKGAQPLSLGRKVSTLAERCCGSGMSDASYARRSPP